jgi:hypothetical protein
MSQAPSFLGVTQSGEAGTKNVAGKPESRNSKSETTKNRKGEKKQFGLRGFKFFLRSDFYFVSEMSDVGLRPRYELRILNLEILRILRGISRISD